jgi:PAS domain S-box-containing protein
VFDPLTPLVLSLPFAPVVVARPRRKRDAFLVFACMGSAGLALLALVGWFGNMPELTKLAPYMPTMKISSAVGMLALAVGVLTLSLGGSRLTQRVRFGACALAVAIGLVTLIEVMLDNSLGVQEWLLRDRVSELGLGATGRPAPVTALSLTLLGMGTLWSGRAAKGAWARWQPAPAVLSFVLGYVASIGLLFGAEWSQSVGQWFATVSLPTAACIVLLSAALTVHSPWHNTVFEALASELLGGKLMRAWLPAVLLLPGAVIWGEDLSRRNGWWPTQVGLVVTVLTMAGTLLLLVAYSARWISKLEAELRSHSEALERRVVERTAELAASHQQLSDSREQLAAIVQTAAVAIVTVDATQRIVVFNAEAERVFGHATPVMIGPPLALLLPQHVANLARAGQAMRPMGGTAELRGLRANGEEFPLAAAIARSGDGPQALTTVVLRDLTQTQVLARERAAREAAEGVVRAKDMFLSRLSHELRTPLNAVSGLSQLLLMQPGALNEVQKRHVELIGVSARQLDMLVGDLLDLSESSAGRLRFRNEPVDLRQLACEALALVAGPAHDAGIALQPVVESQELCIAAGEHGRVLQVVLNLLTNAIKYNRAQGRVEVQLGRVDAQCTVTVIDTGLGLDAPQRKHLFEPFNRLGRERERIEGRGLGLSLSQGLAQAMGGRIDVRSEPGVGSEFTLVLPAHPGA